MSRRDKGRTIDGVILLDKSPGMSSNLALQKVKRLLNARKAGHTGSLDPLATGLLPICLGEATKWSAFLLDDDKRYWVKVRLGQTTTTGDREGETLEERPVPTLTETVVEQILDRFRGPIDQYPPMFSALKFQGRRLYELARQGVEVERAARRVTVHLLKLQAFGGDFLELDVHCSKGTYIRSLAVDIGETFGCGAHVEELRRTVVGPFRVAESLGLAQLEALSDEERLARVRPVDCLLLGLPKISLGDSQTHFIRRGQAVLVPKVSTGGLVRLYSRQLGFLGVGEVNDEGLMAPRRLCRAPVANTSDSQEVADVA